MSESNKPKIAVMLSRFPYPLEKGDKLRAFYQIKELSAFFSIELICISEHNPTPASLSEVNKYCSQCTVYTIPKWKSWLSSLLALVTGKPLQTAYFYSRKIQKKIDFQLKTIQPTHIFCQLIRVSDYVKNYHFCPKTLDYMDAFSAGIERRIAIEPFYLKWLFKMEANRLREYERQVYDYFEFHTIISEQDEKLLGTSPTQKVVCIPNGVSPYFFETMTKAQIEYDLVFVGNLNYPPNVQAVKFVVNEILPEAKKRGLNLSFLAAGADPAKLLFQLQNKETPFDILPNPADIRVAYRKGRVFVAPMKIGTGLQNKLLESMAMGIPSITSQLANNALQALENESILIADTASEFVDKILELNDENKYQEISRECQSYIRQNFDWTNVTKPIIESIKKA